MSTALSTSSSVPLKLSSFEVVFPFSVTEYVTTALNDPSSFFVMFTLTSLIASESCSLVAFTVTSIVSECSLFSALCPPKIGAITSPIKHVSLIRIFIDGPEVSLNGSPTVSPVTAAL